RLSMPKARPAIRRGTHWIGTELPIGNGMSRVYNAVTRSLVTGGAGFLGSHLCERLIKDGHEVLCVDNLFTGTRANIAHLFNHPRFEFQRHDVTFPLYGGGDEIYNLACPASPIHYQ